MNPSPPFRQLFESLQRRRRPEDVAQLILETREMSLDHATGNLLRRVAAGSLRQSPLGYTSMSEDFAPVVGCERQLAKGRELFPTITTEGGAEGVEEANHFINAAAPEIRMRPGHGDFLEDRLNRDARKRQGLELSKRQYNKRFRFLNRLEDKRDRYSRELRKRSFTMIGKSRLASLVAAEDFFADPASAAFMAYYTARCNLRSEFTNTAQQRPFDEIADSLLAECRAKPERARWRAIALVFPDAEVLAHISDEEKGALLGMWFGILVSIAELLKEVWAKSVINRETMIVQKGNDSTTWNNTAGAWNKARDSWFRLLFSLGMEDMIELMCPGKVLRLMAADVAYWHRMSGNTLEADTHVWASLPLPWEVLAGEAECPRTLVLKTCGAHKVDPVQKSWIAPPPERQVAKFRPTPELVHGVTVSHPGLAIFLRKAGFFSGKPGNLHFG